MSEGPLSEGPLSDAAPYGTWPSPISAEMLVSGAVGISEVVPETNACWWAESRPSEGGRTALMRWTPDGGAEEITPPTANVRTRVHEYGGGAWWVDNGTAFYVDYADQRLRSIRPGDPQPTLLSPEPDEPSGLRFADMRVTSDGEWVIAVGETHHADLAEPENALVAVRANGSLQMVTLVKGADFYGSPCVSPDGASLAWVSWEHPNMPWDDTHLWQGQLLDDSNALSVADATLAAGGVGESIVQPSWSPDGVLHYLSDRSDFWYLYASGADEPVLTVEGEIGYPPWVFGLARYAFRSDGSVVAARFCNGVEMLDGYPELTAVNTVRSAGDVVSFVGSSWSKEAAVFFDGEQIREPRDLGLAVEFTPPPEVISFPTGHDGGEGAGQIETAYALYFEPANPDVARPDGERPPLIVLAHGGPTSAARSQLNLARRFWTSRGFAVVDVNYRGSSGFGRAYRKKLDHNWGIADVQDCVSAARFLVDRGDVDSERLIIRGGSAGGFTVLSALAFHDVFTAGANMYGVADLSALALDTHKFESRYLDNLVGRWPEDREIYDARSPINHLDGFTSPMIVLQGDEDEVVPPNQSRMIVDALDERGVPVAYLEFEGEQHGFRKAETIVTALTSELAFYGRVFGFAPDGPSVNIAIRNEMGTP